MYDNYKKSQFCITVVRMSFGREYAGNICEIMRWEKLPPQEKASLELGSMGLGATLSLFCWENSELPSQLSAKWVKKGEGMSLQCYPCSFLIRHVLLSLLYSYGEWNRDVSITRWRYSVEGWGSLLQANVVSLTIHGSQNLVCVRITLLDSVNTGGQALRNSKKLSFPFSYYLSRWFWYTSYFTKQYPRLLVLIPHWEALKKYKSSDYILINTSETLLESPDQNFSKIPGDLRCSQRWWHCPGVHALAWTGMQLPPSVDDVPKPFFQCPAGSHACWLSANLEFSFSLISPNCCSPWVSLRQSFEILRLVLSYCSSSPPCGFPHLLG